MKRVPLLILFLAIFVAFSPPASATLQVLTDGNSTVNISTQTQSGMFDWTVDGVDIMYQQWFWFRVGATGPEASIDSLPLLSEVLTGTNILDLSYGDMHGLEFQIRYSLDGGTPGSATADIGEQINIINHGTTSLTVHFFQYSDFDLNQASDTDIVRIDPSLRFVTQWPVPSSSSIVLSETTESPRPSRAEANYFANTRNKLNDGSPTDLNGVLAAGPGDVTWAFQWDKAIGPGGEFKISKDKLLAPVPEPAAIGLLGGVLVLLASKLRKRMV